MPINLLIIRALINLHRYYGERFKVECPSGSGHLLTLLEVASEIARRIFAIFRRGSDGRPLYGGTEKFQADPHWRDLILFYEYYQGDNGAGIGASHQTGWTGGVALLSVVSGPATQCRSSTPTSSSLRSPACLETFNPTFQKAEAGYSMRPI